MALFVLRKLLKMLMRSHPVGLDVWILVGPFVYFHTTYVRAKSLVTYVISTIVIWTGSNHVLYLMFYVSVDSGPDPAVQPVWLHTADMAECSVENSVKIKVAELGGWMDIDWWTDRLQRPTLQIYWFDVYWLTHNFNPYPIIFSVIFFFFKFASIYKV